MSDECSNRNLDELIDRLYQLNLRTIKLLEKAVEECEEAIEQGEKPNHRKITEILTAQKRCAEILRILKILEKNDEELFSEIELTREEIAELMGENDESS